MGHSSHSFFQVPPQELPTDVGRSDETIIGGGCSSHRDAFSPPWSLTFRRVLYAKVGIHRALDQHGQTSASSASALGAEMFHNRPFNFYGRLDQGEWDRQEHKAVTYPKSDTFLLDSTCPRPPYGMDWDFGRNCNFVFFSFCQIFPLFLSSDV